MHFTGDITESGFSSRLGSLGSGLLNFIYLILSGMANHLVRYATQQSKARITPILSQVRNAHDHAHDHAVGDPVKAAIGNREIVGFGMNGQPNYIDRVDFPLPAIRYKEVTPDIQV